MSAALRPNRPVPLYRQLADALRADIEDGRLAPGAALPVELELCARHGVSRHTAREALRLLSEAGLIARRRGAGTVVAEPPPRPFAQTWGRLDDLLQFARDTSLTVLSLRRASGGDLRAFGLDRAVKDWTLLEAVRRPVGGGPPLALTRIAAPSALMPTREGLEGRRLAIAEHMAAVHGREARRIEQDIEAAALAPFEAKALEAVDGAPALLVRRRYSDAGGSVFQASLSLHPAGRFVWRMTAER